MKNPIVCGLILGFLLPALVMFIVFASGATFGQRCTKAFPESALEQERCIYKLSKGEPL